MGMRFRFVVQLDAFDDEDEDRMDITDIRDTIIETEILPEKDEDANATKLCHLFSKVEEMLMSELKKMGM